MENIFYRNAVIAGSLLSAGFILGMMFGTYETLKSVAELGAPFVNVDADKLRKMIEVYIDYCSHGGSASLGYC